MAPRRILIASPAEPSGGSWLLNCLLELGIKVGHKPFVDNVWRGANPPFPADHIWVRSGSDHRLNPKAEMLVKFLPSAGRAEAFRFRDDIEVDYVQDFPAPQFDTRPLVLIARDPRDSLHSMYRRLSPDLSFAEFCSFPHPATLLDRPKHWALFVAAWLDHPDKHILRFEDYKHDAEATLRAVVDRLDLGCSDAEITAAVFHSTFEKARVAETAYRRKFPGDRQVANRSGTVGDAGAYPDIRAMFPQIEQATAPVLRQLGYAVGETRGDPGSTLWLNAQFLSFFRKIRLPDGAGNPPPGGLEADPGFLALLAFAHQVDEDLIRRAALVPDEARQLVDSLSELSGNYGAWLAARLTALRARYGDGSDHFFQRIRELRKARASAAPGSPD
jgi:hypothetical protein